MATPAAIGWVTGSGFASGAGKVRVIAGNLLGTTGPAKTFTSVNVWDLRLNRDAELTLGLPEGHPAMLVVLSSHLTVAEDPGFVTGAGALLSHRTRTAECARAVRGEPQGRS